MREKSSNYSSIKESYCIAINFKAFLSSRLPDSGCRNSSHVAAGRVGAMRVRLHQTSLTHNLWKLWRRRVCLLEQCLLSASMAHGGFYFTLETVGRDRLWQPRSDHVAPARRADVLQRSPMVAFMDLLLVWRVEVWTTHRAYPVRYGRVQVSVWERTRRLGSVFRSAAAQSAATTGPTHNRE